MAYRDPREALHHGVAMIHQELNPVLDLPVYENLFLGRELRTRFGLVDKAGMRTRESLIIGGVVPDGGRDSVFGLGSRLVVAVVAF